MSRLLVCVGLSCAWLLACRQPPVIIGERDAATDSGSVTPPRPVPPSVLLLLDTSGSMAWLPGCECQTPGCTDCLPDCGLLQRNRWHAVLAAVSGSFESFSCTFLDRTPENGSTYDVGYNKPIYQLGRDTTQRPDGILDRYKGRAHFGLATFDGMRTYTGAGDLVSAADFNTDLSTAVGGQFSYAGNDTAGGLRVRPDGTTVGKVFYPSCVTDYLVDSGIVSTGATEGGLLMPTASDATDQIRSSLRRVRLFGGTPTASALDDLYFAYDQARATAVPDAKQYVIFVTDGYPDDDFREFPNPGCDCRARGDCPANEDAARMSCPYPTADDAALHLRCGFDARGCDGPVSKLFIVGFSISDASTHTRLDAIAAQGGGATFYTDTEAGLAESVNTAMERIVADNAL